MSSPEEPKTFNKGDSVPKEGNYVCVPCGYRKHFSPGEHFSECTSCLSGTPDGEEEYLDGLEMWEPVRTEPPQRAGAPQ